MVCVKPLVSIGVITFNGESHIQEQLQSLLDQSYRNLEIVISDDASSDGTIDVVREFLSDPRMRLIQSEVNQGLHGNLNRLLPQLRGDYIAICDQDDIWSTDKIQVLLDSVGTADGVYSDSLLIDSSGVQQPFTLLETLGISRPAMGREYLALAYKNSISGHAALYSRRVIEEALPFLEKPLYDQQLAIRAAAGRGICYVESPLVCHRQHAANSHNKGLLESGRNERPSRRARAIQVGGNLQIAAEALFSAGKLSFRQRFLASFVHTTGVLLQGERHATATVVLWLRLLILSRALFKQSRKRNLLSLLRRLVTR